MVGRPIGAETGTGTRGQRQIGRLGQVVGMQIDCCPRDGRRSSPAAPAGAGRDWPDGRPAKGGPSRDPMGRCAAGCSLMGLKVGPIRAGPRPKWAFRRRLNIFEFVIISAKFALHVRPDVA